MSPGDKASQSGEKADKRTNHNTGTTKDRLGIDQTIELKEGYLKKNSGRMMEQRVASND